jgi:radical SAM protein with 4Fe4S-binding SPASM domain
MGGVKVLRYFMLGEALLHKDALAMFRYAHDLGVAERTELSTNLSALPPKKVDELIHSGLDYLRVSVYAMDPARHKEITGSSITPARIAANTRAVWERRAQLQSERPFIYVKMIDLFDPEETRQLHEVYDGIADEVYVEPPHNWNDYGGRDLVTGALGDHMPAEGAGNFAGKQAVCPFPFYRPVIHSDGEVSVCCVDWNKKTSVGNVFRESFGDIWRGPRLKAFQRMHIERRRHEHESCRDCNFFRSYPDNIDELTDSAILDR